MRLDNRTVQILKNFSTINPSLLFTKGKTLTTVSPSKTTMARAVISEEVPSSFAIYELSRFLGVVSLFDSPSLDIGDSSMTIKSGKQKVNYTFADPRTIVSPSDKLIEWLETGVPTPEVTFDLTADDLQNVLKAMQVLQLPELAITGENDHLYLEAIDSKNPTADNYRVQLGTTTLTFRMIFKMENVKVVPGDYNVGICSSGLAVFSGDNVQYWITSEATSTFTK